MPTPGNGVDGGFYGSPAAPYPVQRYHEPPPAYETISNIPSLYANPVDPQLNVTPSAPIAPNDVSFYAPAWPPSHNGSQVHVPANAPQWNVHLTTTLNNIPYNIPTANHPLVTSAQNSAALEPQNTVRGNQTKGKFSSTAVFMIMSAIVHIGFGIGVASNQHGSSSRTISCGIPFWAAILHIITGSVNGAAHMSPPRCKISCALILTAGTLIICVIDLALNIMDFNDARDCFMDIRDFWESSRLCFHASPLYWGLIATNGFIILFSLIFICIGCGILSNWQ